MIRHYMTCVFTLCVHIAFSTTFACSIAGDDLAVNNTLMISIRELVIEDFDNGFLETLAALKPAAYSMEKIKEIFKERSFKGIHTYVAVEEGRIIATASLIIEQKFNEIVAFLEDVATRKECQKKALEEG